MTAAEADKEGDEAAVAAAAAGAAEGEGIAAANLLCRIFPLPTALEDRPCPSPPATCRRLFLTACEAAFAIKDDDDDDDDDDDENDEKARPFFAAMVSAAAWKAKPTRTVLLSFPAAAAAFSLPCPLGATAMGVTAGCFTPLPRFGLRRLLDHDAEDNEGFWKPPPSSAPSPPRAAAK